MTPDEARSIPRSVAICPICGKGLLIDSIDEAFQEDDGDLYEIPSGGRWLPSEVAVTCETEPDIDSEEWHGWHKHHFATPYIDWLPLTEKVLQWLQALEQKHRFEVLWEQRLGFYEDPVVLYDPVTGPVTDSQLRQICEDVVQQAKESDRHE